MKSFCLPAYSFALLFVSFASVASAEMPRDSVGVEKKGSKILVLYKVEAGETLSSISRKYNTSVDAIKAENTIEGNSLQLGEIIKVPYHPVSKMATAGKKIHVVEASQGLYSIARTYGVTVEDIMQWNNLASNQVQVGQELIVGDEKGTTAGQGTTAQAQHTANQSVQASSPTAEVTARVNDAGKKVHTVEASQGLYAIAKMYNVTVEDLRAWNNLATDNLRVGQELYLEDAGQEAVAQTTKEAIPEVTAVTEPARETDKRRDKQERKEARSNPAPVSNTQPVAASDKEANDSNFTIANTSGYVKKVEVGLAESIGETQDNDMFLALHRTAPIGTIMQVRNQMNDLSVFVKVIGKLPNTGANDKLVVKISRKAYERLAAIDKRFRVEVSYMP